MGGAAFTAGSRRSTRPGSKMHLLLTRSVQSPLRRHQNLCFAKLRRGTVGWLTFGIVASLLAVSSTDADVLYETDFESFVVGDDNLADQDGWNGTNVGQHVHGIVSSVNPVLGKSGFLGINSPASSIVLVNRNIDFFPNQNGSNVVKFSSTLAINRSTNGEDDYFSVVLFNQDNDLLASIVFDTFDGSIRRRDGVSGNPSEKLAKPFDYTTPFELSFRIDFAANQWTAKIDGNVIFSDRQFNGGGAALNLKTIGIAWTLFDEKAPGNNWILFDHWRVESCPTLRITSIAIDQQGAAVISWPVESGFQYRIEASNDLSVWLTNLPQSVFLAQPGDTEFTYSDSMAQGVPRRHYRVVNMGPIPTP